MPNTITLKPLGEIIEKTFTQIETRCRNILDPVGITTGFQDLDELISGLQPSTLTVIGASPAMGKTSIVLSLLDYVAFNDHNAEEKILTFFSMETPKELLTERLLCLDANVNLNNLHTGKLTEKDWESLWKACNRLTSTNIYIDDSYVLTTNDIRERLNILKKRGLIGIVVIDSIQSIAPISRRPKRNDELDEITRDLKAIATEFNVPVLVTSQLNNIIEDRYFKRPRLSDICDSNYIANWADLILLLYREDYYHPDTDNQNVAELIIAKNRYGPTGTIFLFFQKELCKFRCLSFNRKKKIL